MKRRKLPISVEAKKAEVLRRQMEMGDLPLPPAKGWVEMDAARQEAYWDGRRHEAEELERLEQGMRFILVKMADADMSAQDVRERLLRLVGAE